MKLLRIHFMSIFIVVMKLLEHTFTKREGELSLFHDDSQPQSITYND